MSERAYWLAFGLIKGMGPVRIRRLLRYFGQLSKAWQASQEQLLAAGLSNKAAAQQILQIKTIDPLAVPDNLAEKGIKTVIWNDPDYPRYLAQIAQPPHVLFYKGNLDQQDDLSVAIVGTRKVTGYGRQVTADVVRYLTGNGITIVSGLARGVDAIAHRTALEAGGRTLAVLGSGVDVIYPPEHRKLAQEIEENGAVMSSYPPGTQPEGINFPPRNRIISGLSRATVVVEAGARSGALITADFAIDQGREVFSVPGSVFQAMSVGTNALIAKGAIPMNNPAMILEQLNLPRREAQTSLELPVFEENEKRILQCLGDKTLDIDELAASTNMPIENLNASLTMMELKGYVRRDAGLQFTANQAWKF